MCGLFCTDISIIVSYFDLMTQVIKNSVTYKGDLSLKKTKLYSSDKRRILVWFHLIKVKLSRVLSNEYDKSCILIGHADNRSCNMCSFYCSMQPHQIGLPTQMHNNQCVMCLNIYIIFYLNIDYVAQIVFYGLWRVWSYSIQSRFPYWCWKWHSLALK